MERNSKLIAAVVVAGLTAITLAGCDASYITHAAYEEVRILLRRKPITSELARSELPAATGAKLKTVLAVRSSLLINSISTSVAPTAPSPKSITAPSYGL